MPFGEEDLFSQTALCEAELQCFDFKGAGSVTSITFLSSSGNCCKMILTPLQQQALIAAAPSASAEPCLASLGSPQLPWPPAQRWLPPKHQLFATSTYADAENNSQAPANQPIAGRSTLFNPHSDALAAHCKSPYRQCSANRTSLERFDIIPDSAWRQTAGAANVL